MCLIASRPSPDFRSPNGIWSKATPIYYDEFVSSEAARREAWRRKFDIDRDIDDTERLNWQMQGPAWLSIDDQTQTTLTLDRSGPTLDHSKPQTIPTTLDPKPP